MSDDAELSDEPVVWIASGISIPSDVAEVLDVKIVPLERRLNLLEERLDSLQRNMQKVAFLLEKHGDTLLTLTESGGSTQDALLVLAKPTPLVRP